MNPITYHRNARLYTFALPTGAEGSASTRAEAEAQYLRAVAPALARQVEHCAAQFPALADRARRAAFIVLAGAVTLKRQMVGAGRYLHYEVARVAGSQPQPYSVWTDDGKYYCDCPDASGEEPQAPAHNLAKHMCKHILAVLLSD